MLAQRLADLAKTPKILTWDIETSPAIVYSWGLFGQDHSVSQIIEPSRVLCFAAKWLDKKSTEFYSEYHTTREDMIEQAWRLLDEADMLVSYNGIGFDMKHMNREFLLAGLGPVSPFVDIDLLRINRANFKFLSNKLGYVTQAVGLPTKLETGGMELWKRVLDNDPAAWAKFKQYNIRDVVVTEKLYLLLAQGGWVKGVHAGLFSGNMSTCHSCGSADLTPVGVIYSRSSAWPKAVCVCGTFNKVLGNGQTRAA
jgi:DNA polymerase III epsilon subunit-like protein